MNVKTTQMKKLITFLLVILSIGCIAQSTQKFNFGFETKGPIENLSKDWAKIGVGTFELGLDSAIVHSGKYAAKIAATVGPNAGVGYKIPANYVGKTIKLEGFMKIENVENGFAGLVLRINGGGTVLAIDVMQNQNINGTKDWQKYTITLPYPEIAENILVGGIIIGKGNAWFDDFVLTIDDQDVQTLEETVKLIPKAKLDKEFDQGSNFHLSRINKVQIEKLFKLSKIWGFLKYHHPEIAKGNLNWDYELFRILPKLESSDFEGQILKWVKSIGGVNSELKEKLVFSGVKIQPDTKWIADKSFLSKEFCQELSKIENSQREDLNYYLSFTPDANPIFKNENPYPGMKWDDTDYQLLSLFRYWNMIEYFFPYKHLTEKNWNDVLLEYIPQIIVCEDELSYKLTILGLIGEVHDTHANMRDKTLNQFYGNNTAPLEINFIENKAVVVKISKQLNNNSGIKVGDVITKINGIETEKVIAEKIKYCPASNYPTQLRDLSERLLRTNDNVLNLTLENQTKTYGETVNTVPITDISFRNTEVSSHSEIGKDIGYIYPGSLKNGEIDEIMNSFLNKKGIIIDMRCNPSDFIVFSLGKYLMPKPTEFVKFTITSLTNPGLFTFADTLKVGKVNPDYFKGKVIILVNEITQSSAEYTTMALKLAPNATVIGSTTAGADGNVSAIVLPGNIRTMISGIGVYYPDGTETQRIGIVPDIIVKPTIEGIKLGKDEVLDKAIEIINNIN